MARSKLALLLAAAIAVGVGGCTMVGIDVDTTPVRETGRTSRTIDGIAGRRS